MARRLTKKAIRSLLSKRLTGREAGKLVLQDFIDASCGKPSLLSEADIAAIRNAPMQGQDVRDYNMLMALSRALDRGMMICNMACKDACLDMFLLIITLRDVEKRGTVELFASFRPHVVTRKQYEDIVDAQREMKLSFEYSLAYVVEERFFAISPPEVRKDIDDMAIDIDSGESFRTAVQDKYTDLYKQAITEVHKLHTSGELNAVYHDDEAKEVEPLLDKWQKKGLSGKEAAKLVDMLFVTGQQLYKCDELPEWKEFIDKYQTGWFSDEDKRFGYAYAILQNPSECWVDEKGYYKETSPVSEWITRGMEATLGLRGGEGEKAKSIQTVSSDLRAVLSRVELNARIFLAMKEILEGAVNAVELDIPDEGWTFSNLDELLKLYVEDYNHKLAKVKEGSKPWNSKESELQKVLKTLPAIDLDKLKPSDKSMQWLKNSILDGLRDDGWLQEKLSSLEYADGFGFGELLGKG